MLMVGLLGEMVQEAAEPMAGHASASPTDSATEQLRTKPAMEQFGTKAMGYGSTWRCLIGAREVALVAPWLEVGHLPLLWGGLWIRYYRRRFTVIGLTTVQPGGLRKP